jgi:acyl-CoA synthetase (AMP-forming)/AMP-acid ligase II/acyl carrier protein
MHREDIFAAIADIICSVDGRFDRQAIRLDDTPFRDQGLNSLAQMQIAARVEDEFDIVLDDMDALTASSMVRLVRLIEDKIGPGESPELKNVNLLSAIYDTAERVGSSRGVHFLEYGSDDVFISYEELLGMSAWLSQKMPENTPDRPRVVVIAAKDQFPTLMAFLAALGAGSVPLILPSPQTSGGMEAFIGRIERTVARFPDYCVLALQDGLVPSEVRLPDVPVVPLSPSAAEYGTASARPLGAELSSGDDDVAFLQMTSASTGDSKLVAISHANICANLAGLHEALGLGPDERVMSWLPLYHDMGLVGTTLCSFFHGYSLIMMKPIDFIMRPHLWIEVLSRFRCTSTAAPNFGYDYASRAVTDKDIEGADLSAVKYALCGAEPIRLATLQAFSQRFRKYGFSASSLTCCYGMAESTLGTTMASPGRTTGGEQSSPRYLLVDPARTAIGEPVRILGEGRVDSVPRPGQQGVAVFSVGPAVTGVEVSLVDEEGGHLGEEHTLGEIALRGPSVSAGYFDSAAARPVPFPDGVFRTGDLGFFDGGNLFILERKKNIIIRQGRNFLTSLIEEQVAHILGWSVHELIVFDTDIHDPASDISVLLENLTTEVNISEHQLAALRSLDLPIDVLFLSRKRAIPRTTSGKKKYHETRRRIAAQVLKIDQVIRIGPPGES